MLQKKGIMHLASCMLVIMFISLIPLSVQAVGSPVFEELSISSSFDNSIATLRFNEKVYPGINTKERLSAENLNVSVVGGTATLNTYYIQQMSRNRAEIILNINGNADGSEMLIVKPAGVNKIYNGSSIAMAADAQISVALRDMSSPELAEGYPMLHNITGNSVELKIKSNEAGRAYYVVAEEGNHSPAYLEVKFGFIWNGNGWGPVADNRKGSTVLQANSEASIAINGLETQTRYYIYVILKDQLDNHSAVSKLELNTGSASSNQATVSSTSYTVNNSTNTISGVVYGTTLADFTANLSPASGASMQIYQADGTTEASDLADGYKLTLTAADTTTSKTYTISLSPVLSNLAEISSFSILDPSVQGVISGNGILVVVPRGTPMTALVASFSLSNHASAKVGSTVQASGITPNDFSSAVSYTITAQDNSTKIFTVRVVDEIETLKNAVLVGQHLFQLDDSNGLTRENVISAISTGSNLWYKSSNGSWYDLMQINCINDLFEASKAIHPGELIIKKWYKAGETVQNIP